MPFIPSNEQLADLLTKGLLKPTFDYLTSKLGMINIYELAWEEELHYFRRFDSINFVI